jgi:PadR family transcriptional regulator, regulatory protein AphA
MKANSVTYVILGVLRLGPRTGYEIKALVDRSTRFFWAASYGQIYPELKRLEREGLIRGEPEPRGGRRRRSYTLTPAGERALNEWLRSSEDPTFALRDEALLKFFFAGELEPDEAIAHVRAMRAQHEEILANLSEIEPQAAGRGGGFPLRTLQFGLGFHGWIVEWCDRMEKEIAAEGRQRAETRR